MRFISTKSSTPAVSLADAVNRCVAPDGGLYMPEAIPQLPRAFFNNIGEMSLVDIAYVIALAKESENEAYLENYLALLLSSSESFVENEEKIDGLYAKIETNFEKNKNLKTFESAIKKYKDENTKDDKNGQTENGGVFSGDSESEASLESGSADGQPVQNESAENNQ